MTEARTRRWRPLDLIQVTASFLEKQNIDSPRLAAESLLAHALGWQRIDLYTRFETDLPDESVGAFRELVKRRRDREPLQYILGRTEFRSLAFVCDARVLAPRPETEQVVELALARVQGLEAPMIADIGTGSGCIAVSLAKELPNARVVATDISLPALEVALANVESHGLTDRVRLLEGDLAQPLLAEGLGGRLDLVVSNPPYVASDEFETLQPEVRDYEPRVALDGGTDGLDVYRRLFKEVVSLLRCGGAAVVEMPDRRSSQVRALADELGWSNISVDKDHAGIERVLTAEKPGEAPG